MDGALGPRRPQHPHTLTCTVMCASPHKEYTPMGETKYVMPPAWRIEARVNAFVPWITVEVNHRLEDAVTRSAVLKRKFHYYLTRVRAN